MSSRVPQSPQERSQRKQRVLAQGMPSVVASITDAQVIKEGAIFLLCRADGQIPLDGAHGYGLYFGDARYLCGYDLRLGGRPPNALAVSSEKGYRMTLELTNPDIEGEGGRVAIPKEQLGLTWDRIIDVERSCLYDIFSLRNFGHEPIEVDLELKIAEDFDDVFEIRGLYPDRTANGRTATWRDGALVHVKEGADGRFRSLALGFDREPTDRRDDGAAFHLKIAPQATESISVTIDVGIANDAASATIRLGPAQAPARIDEKLGRSIETWMKRELTFESDSPQLNRAMERSLLDLRTLRGQLSDHAYVMAGIPWFGTLFGRDSLLTALQFLPFDRSLAADTLRLLAKLQGDKNDPYRDEEPGKILHEWRDGELARTGAIPHSPAYYGSVDATLLFLILLERHYRWVGDLALFRELRESVHRALEWVRNLGDHDGDGYIDYECSSDCGLVNQGWKDSGNAIVTDQGELAKPPIALVEIQAYAYAARASCAELFRRAGDTAIADELVAEAEALRRRFDKDYWSEELGCYVLALHDGGKQCRVVSSNAGHALWAGIAEPDKARRTVERLMAEDMFSGWGVRTLSAEATAYNPIGYHLGTIWPHDNALIACGFRRYGFDEEARRITRGTTDAAMHFRNERLPELFCGFPRRDFHRPVPYPVACHPQAWSAAALPYLVTTELGLEPFAAEGRLRLRQPDLPDFVDRAQLRGLRVGEAIVDLRFSRTPFGGIAVEVERLEGDLEVVVVPRPRTEEKMS